MHSAYSASDDKSPAVTATSDYDWSDALSGCFCFRQLMLHETGGARPLSVSGSRYRILNVTTDASSIVTKKTIMILVCLSIKGSFRIQNWKRKVALHLTAALRYDLLKTICTRGIEINARTDIQWSFFFNPYIDLGTEYWGAFQGLPHTAERTSGQIRQSAVGWNTIIRSSNLAAICIFGIRARICPTSNRTTE